MLVFNSPYISLWIVRGSQNRLLPLPVTRAPAPVSETLVEGRSVVGSPMIEWNGDVFDGRFVCL